MITSEIFLLSPSRKYCSFAVSKPDFPAVADGLPSDQNGVSILDELSVLSR